MDSMRSDCCGVRRWVAAVYIVSEPVADTGLIAPDRTRLWAMSQLLASAHSAISTRVADRRLASFCSAEGNSLGSSAPRVAALLAIRRLIAASGSLHPLDLFF